MKKKKFETSKRGYWILSTPLVKINIAVNKRTIMNLRAHSQHVKIYNTSKHHCKKLNKE